MNAPLEHDRLAQNAALELKKRISEADPDTLALLLTEARTHYGWKDTPVSEDQLRQLFDIAIMGPTSMNQQPIRIVFVTSAEQKERLKPALLPGNVIKTMGAPVTAILGFDTAFYENMPRLFPPNPNARDIFANNLEKAEVDAFRNGTLQAAYFMIAARAIGLDVGPMSGFDNKAVDNLFFAGTTTKSNFLCNLGHADVTKIFRRLPRLSFDDAATII